MDNFARARQPDSVSESERQRRTHNRLGRLARDRESLREMRAILSKIYGKSAITTTRDRQF